MKLLIIDEMHPSLFDMLDGAGFLYDYKPAIKRAEILAIIADYEGLIIRSKTQIDEPLLNFATKLRFVARAGAGLDLIDIDTIKRRNIVLFAANEGNKDAVAEHTVGLLLGLMANIAKADREIRRGLWSREANRGYEIMGKTVGIIGYGFNGKATAQRLSGFGCKVLAYDKYLTNYGDSNAKEATMEQIFEEADIVSLHIPLTDHTRLMVDDDYIDQFKKPFFFVNISRGEIVDLAAIAKNIEAGKIRGAALDVLENEKLDSLSPQQKTVFDYLKTSDKVIFTPHIAGWSHESYVKINEVMVRQIKNKFG